MQYEGVKAMIEAWAEAGDPELELDVKEERAAALGPLPLRARRGRETEASFLLKGARATGLRSTRRRAGSRRGFLS